MPENGPPQGRASRQQSVPSASRLPGSSSRMFISPQVASARYVKQFQALMEHQRHTFDEERALWNIERMELHEKITQLAGSLHQYQAISPSQISSSINSSDSESHRNSSVWSLLSKDGSSDTSTDTTGDEIWRGPKTDVQPTRTFSDPTTQSTKPRGRDRLPSIAEDTTCGRKDSSDLQSGLRKPSVSGAQTDKSLDGINFKSSTFSPVPDKVMTPQSPSPRTTSPSRLSPGTIQLPSYRYDSPLDPYTKDAGHTPLARRTYFHIDGASSEGDGATPTQPEMERPPLEPHVSFAKLPSERSDSYFPVVDRESRDDKDTSRDGEETSPDEDSELKAPLGLNSYKGDDEQFLNELDSKLLQAARSEEFSPSGVGSDKESFLDNDGEFEQPEDEPKLRIKRSMNFGSAFGAKTCGKGI